MIVMRPLGLAILLLASLAFELYGQVGVEVEVEFGFAGQYLPDWPAPIWVSIEGRSPLQGRIIISQEVRSPWRGVVEERLVLPFVLPGKGKKRFELEFLVRGYIYPLQLAVVADPTGETIFRREIALKERAAEEPLTLALVGRGEPFPMPMELPTGERPIRLEPEGFPSSWAGLLGAGRIYLGRLYPEELSPAQWAALIRWIEWGGELVVLGGENWYLLDSPRLRELIPFNPTGIGEAAGRKVVLGEPRGEVLSRQGEIMLVAGPRGRGRGLFATVNLLANPGEGGVWESLGRELLQRAGEEEQLRLGAELLEQTSLPFPSKPVLIGLYALFVGGLALSSWLAARRKRARPLPLLWVAGIAAFTVGYLDRPEFARPLFGLESGLSHDLGETTLHSSWLGLFAKAGRRLELRVVRQGEDDEGYLRQALPEERGERLYDVTYLPGRGGTMSASFSLADWQERSFFLERFSGDLARLRLGGEGRVWAENKSPYPLRDCRLLSDEGRLYELEPGPAELGPGEAVEWGLGPEIEPPKEGPVARIYKLARTELRGPHGLLCAWAAPGEFSQTPLEVRTILRLALIEEDQ